jgi:hypothetical protein
VEEPDGVKESVVIPVEKRVPLTVRRMLVMTLWGIALFLGLRVLWDVLNWLIPPTW